MTKPRYTLEQHQETGQVLKAMGRWAARLCVDLSHHYPNTQVEKPSHRVLDAIEKLKCRLDDLVCQEHPDKPNSVVLSCYYGGGQESDEDEPLKVWTAGEIMAHEFPPESPEHAYRRGYCDGWIEAANAYCDIWRDRDPQQIYDLLFDHWEKELGAWRRKKTQRKLEFPPRLAGIGGEQQ